MGGFDRRHAGLEQFWLLWRRARSLALWWWVLCTACSSSIRPYRREAPRRRRTFRNTALLIPFAHVLFCTMVAWDFEMTLQPGWSSAIYAMYHFVSSFGMMLSVLALTVMLLVRKQALISPPGEYIFNYLAQLMLAFTILWVYTFFAQYLIIWYANLPDETERLFHDQYGPFWRLFWIFFILKFVMPFLGTGFPLFALHRPRDRLVAVSIIIGYWIERYTWIAGSDAGLAVVDVLALRHRPRLRGGFQRAFFMVRGAMRKFGRDP